MTRIEIRSFLTRPDPVCTEKENTAESAVFSFSVCSVCLQKSVSSVLEALAAVDGTVVVRLERNLALLAAVGAGSVEHLAGRSLTALSLAGVAAITASLGLVGEALLGVELLLAGGENEFASAILADNGLVSVHCITSSFSVHFLHMVFTLYLVL